MSGEHHIGIAAGCFADLRCAELFTHRTRPLTISDWVVHQARGDGLERGEMRKRPFLATSTFAQSSNLQYEAV